jgi:hypothetical protein
MSSTLSRNRVPRSSRAPEVPLVRGTEAEPALGEGAQVAATDERDFAQFLKAVCLGIAIGIPVMTLIVASIVKVAAPEMAIGAAFAIAAWVAVFTGFFLAGTVTVGLLAGKHQH